MNNKYATLLFTLLILLATTMSHASGYTEIRYKTNYGIMTLRFIGPQVTGSYTDPVGQIRGVLTGVTMPCTWKQSNASGKCLATFSPDYERIDLKWNYDGESSLSRSSWGGYQVSRNDVYTNVNIALADGCRSAKEANLILDDIKNSSNVGTTMKRVLNDYNIYSDGWVTRLDVTDPTTWGYRGLTIPGEDLRSGKLQSKAQRAIIKNSARYNEASFWKTNGPNVGFARNNLALAMQMYATTSTDAPPSQFVSVALDFNVARNFAINDAFVYRFQLSPQSPILGLTNCALKGEVQFQVPGGTPIRNLQRCHKNGGNWYEYNKMKDTWEQTKSTCKVNEEKMEL